MGGPARRAPVEREEGRAAEGATLYVHHYRYPYVDISSNFVVFLDLSEIYRMTPKL